MDFGDRIFVSKYSYGYSKHSFPFSPNFSNQRFFSKKPKRGDVIIFNFPRDIKQKYVKRCVAEPGDILQIIDKTLFINGQPQALPENGKFIMSTLSESFLMKLDDVIGNSVDFQKLAP